MSRSTDADHVLERMHALMHNLKHHMQAAAAEDGSGLGWMEARCLNYFKGHPGATQSDLVQHSGRDKAQIARIVKGMVERGLLHSQPNPADGRSQVLSVSALGKDLQRKLQWHRAQFEKRMMTGLSDGERTTLVTLLEKLQRNADTGQG